MRIRHPATEDLEEYYFGRLTRYLGETIESHFLTCDRCTQELLKLDEFVAALSSAISPATSPVDDKSYQTCHATTSG
jgi:hypothetical protein